MAARKKSRASAGGDSAQAMRDSAQKIWLAGLGAFERAKSEGPKMFETLVTQGRDLSGRAREAADQALRAVREQAGEAQGRWDKLEQVFEERVSRSLGRLGVMTRGEMNDLARQVEALNANVREMMRGAAKPAAGAARKARGGARKAKGKAKRKAAPKG
jgi:poly(hydroxyalkanoate) granule-associated protein